MFKQGDIVRYVGNSFPSLRGKDLEIQDVDDTIPTIVMLKFKGHPYYHQDHGFILVASAKTASQNTNANNGATFKVGDIVKLYGNNYPHLRGKDLEVTGVMNGLNPGSMGGWESLQFKDELGYHDAIHFGHIIILEDPPAYTGMNEDEACDNMFGYISKKEPEKEKSEGDKMMDFFKASSHDKKATW